MNTRQLEFSTWFEIHFVIKGDNWHQSNWMKVEQVMSCQLYNLYYVYTNIKTID